MSKVLIIDDDEQICKILAHCIIRLGHPVETAFTLGEGEEKLSSGSFDLVFLDVNLPDGNGVEALPRIQSVTSSPEVVIITGVGDPDGAELAIKNGAWDYLEKPFTKEEVQLQLVRVLQYREEKSVPNAPVALKREGLVGNSPQISACLDLLAQAAQSNANVLVTGETGTGKELFARAIHENSPRADRPFLVVDCTVLPEKLVESVLFGHEKGAFTGADNAHNGLIKQAHGGTLFLDEIGELPIAIQKAFLRVLQEHRFRSVGGRQEITSDFRLVAATNRDLDTMAKTGQFRQDLLFRLQTFSLELPPLRERIEDIKDIAISHAAKICEHTGVETKGFAPEFFEILASYNWPGNVRELVNTLERAIAIEPLNPVLYPKHLPDHIRARVIRATINGKRPFTPIPKALASPTKQPPKLKELRERSMEALERRYLHDLMQFTAGNIKQSCRISGLGRTRLYELMKKYNVSKIPKTLSSEIF